MAKRSVPGGPAQARALMADAALLRAVAHPVRLGIMRYIAETPETCACDFADIFEVAQPTVSQHLKVLRDAGLVRTHRRGTQICYSVDPAGLQAIAQILVSLSRADLTSAS
jgi:ArsR family transcriptional regulator, arsenate/arsenite/antimonite-responsive transcriptional repressor